MNDTRPDAAARLTEGELQAVPGEPAGVMCHQDPRRQFDLDEMMGDDEDA